MIPIRNKTLRLLNKKCSIAKGSIPKNKNMTIYGYKNSTAQKYAKKNHIKFVKIK